MKEWYVTKTANRSLVGVMSEFSYLGEVFSAGSTTDLHGLSIRLAHTPCGPLRQREGFPDLELRALLGRLGELDDVPGRGEGHA